MGFVPGYWKCHGNNGGRCGHLVPHGEFYCGSCGNQPPERVSCPDKAKAGKSGGKGTQPKAAKGKGGTGAKGTPQAESFAAKQVKEAAEAHRKAAKVTQQLAEERKLRAALEVQLAAKAGGSAVDQAARPSAGETLQADLEESQGLFNWLRNLPPQFHGTIGGGYAETLAAAEAKRDAIKASQRVALPLKDQLARAQNFVEMCDRQGDAARKKEDKLAEQLAELQAKVAEAAAATAAAAAKTEAGRAELAVIAAKVAAENGKQVEGSDVPPSPGTLATGEEAELIRNLLLLVPANTVSANFGPKAEDIGVQAMAVVKKLAAQASSGALQQQIAEMQQLDAERSEALRKLQDQMDDGDSDLESEAPSQACWEEVKKRRREKKVQRSAARRNGVSDVLSKFSAGKAA